MKEGREWEKDRANEHECERVKKREWEKEHVKVNTITTSAQRLKRKTYYL